MKKTIYLAACMLLLSCASYAQSLSVSSQYWDSYVEDWEIYDTPYNNSVHYDLAAGRTIYAGSQGGAFVGYATGGVSVVADQYYEESLSGSVSSSGTYLEIWVWGSYGGWGSATVLAY